MILYIRLLNIKTEDLIGFADVFCLETRPCVLCSKNLEISKNEGIKEANLENKKISIVVTYFITEEPECDS